MRKNVDALDSVRRGPSEAGAGTQSLQRSIDLLKSMAYLDTGRGVRIVDLCEHLGLERPTVHRILACLERNEMIGRVADSRRYQLGQAVTHLGLAAARQYDLPEVCAPSLSRLAELTGDTVFLTVRSGADCVTVARYEGDYPVKALTLNVGERRPLVVGAGAMALLASMPQHDVEELLTQNLDNLPRYTDLTRQSLLTLVTEAREAGYVINRAHVNPEVTAVGMAICNRDGVALGAISVAAISQRMTDDRISATVALMRKEIAIIQARLGLASGHGA